MMASGAQSIGLDVDSSQPKMKSVLEMDNLTDFLGQAEMAQREFTSEKEQFVILDAAGVEYNQQKPGVQWADETEAATPSSEFQFRELSVPRRPVWTVDTTAEELHRLENDTFLAWRRGIAHFEESWNASASSVVATPFEKNLEVWRQLWRVLERSSCLVQIVDARNPLFYFSEDLRVYAEEELGKPMLLVINKSDYLSVKQRQCWHEYFHSLGVRHLFFSAHQEQQILDGEGVRMRAKDTSTVVQEESPSPLMPKDNVTHLLTRIELLDYLKEFGRANNCQPSPTSGRVEFGTIGFPNVGKSSIINVLIGFTKNTHNTVRVAVAAQPGKTKHFQTILLTEESYDDMMLCDCPGLVFPSFVSNSADLIAAGVYPINQMREAQALDVVRLICERVPLEVLEAMYAIKMKRATNADTGPTLTVTKFLDTFCHTRHMLNASSGTPDHHRASRIFIQDYVVGKLLFCHAPPSENGLMTQGEFEKETILMLVQNTRKLREKLGVLPLEEQPEENIDDQERLNEDVDVLDLLEELDNFEMKNGSDRNNVKSSSSTSGTHKKHNNKPITKKWGKKGKKFRNSDPYGCHSDPDPLLLSSIGAGAIASGKYGGAGYTRPNYSGTNSAVPFEVKNRGKPI